MCFEPGQHILGFRVWGLGCCLEGVLKGLCLRGTGVWSQAYNKTCLRVSCCLRRGCRSHRFCLCVLVRVDEIGNRLEHLVSVCVVQILGFRLGLDPGQEPTLPRVKRERLMELVSFSISPEALVSLTRSLPARSTKLTCTPQYNVYK